MAYLIQIKVTCDNAVRSCSKRATVEVFDYRNESRGKYCTPCGKKVLAERERFERSEAGARRD